MTVETTTSRQALTFDGVTVAFDFTFPYIEATDINVYDGSDLVAAADYTITANPTGVGGTVTFDTAPAAGTGMLVRNAPFTQESRIPNVDKMGQGLLENALDKITILTQQLQDTTERSLTYPVYADTTGISAEIPVPEALGYLRGNAAGDAYETSLAVETAFTVPGLTGEGGSFVRVNSGETNFQFDTVAEVKTALGLSGLAALAYLATVGTAQIDANAVTPAKFEANKLVGSYCRFGIVKASGGNGGTSTAGSIQTLPINTEIYDPDGLFALSGSDFTLAPGDYYMEGSQSIYGITNNCSSALELYDVTAGVIVDTVHCKTGWSTEDVQQDARLFGNFTCAEASPGVNRTYRIRYLLTAGAGIASSGLGVGAGTNTLVHGHFKLIKES